METSQVGSVKLMKELLREGKGFDAEELAEIHALAQKHEGAIVGVASGDDDWCGTGRVNFKFPRPGVGAFLEQLLSRGIVFDVWRYGQPPRIDGLAVNIRKDVMR